MAETITFALNKFDRFLERGGDPLATSWFLVRGVFWQFFLPILYVMFVKVLGPALMKNRQPIKWDIFIIIYNFSLVFIYSSCVTGIAYYTVKFNLYYVICERQVLQPDTPIYYVARCLYVLYLVKYLEYIDTINFVLRKKYRSITNLHLIHHAVLPTVGWLLIKTDFSGYQAIPVFVNGILHSAMYFYYGIAAMGPRFRRFLWWKKYLTMMQMAQFVAVVFSGSFMLFSGCDAERHGLFIIISFEGLMLFLFYKFFVRTYGSAARKQREINNRHEEKED